MGVDGAYVLLKYDDILMTHSGVIGLQSFGRNPPHASANILKWDSYIQSYKVLNTVATASSRAGVGSPITAASSPPPAGLFKT